MRTYRHKRKKSAYSNERRKLEAVLYEEAKEDKVHASDAYISNSTTSWRSYYGDTYYWKSTPFEKLRLNRAALTNTIRPLPLAVFIREILQPFLDDKIFGLYQVYEHTFPPEGVYVSFKVERDAFYDDYLVPAIRKLAESHEMLLVKFRRGIAPPGEMYVGVICKKHFSATLHINTE